MRLRAIVLLALAVILTACSGVPAERLTVVVHAEYPHSTEAFTQGLLYDGEHIFESTGLVGRSSVRRVDLETGRVLRQSSVPAPYFGEGLELVDDTLYMLSWQHEVGFMFDKDTLQQTGEFTYSGEGWGLCHDGADFWMSNGTSTLTKYATDTFESLATVTVKLEGKEVELLNELECVDGYVYANIWLTEEIMKINPNTGVVVAHIDATPLLDRLPEALTADAVLNGIAYNEQSGEFYLTGKLWSKLFAVSFEAVR